MLFAGGEGTGKGVGECMGTHSSVAVRQDMSGCVDVESVCGSPHGGKGDACMCVDVEGVLWLLPRKAVGTHVCAQMLTLSASLTGTESDGCVSVDMKTAFGSSGGGEGRIFVYGCGKVSVASPTAAGGDALVCGDV